MTKYILGGTFITLGVIQLADWNATRPEIGNPLTAVVVVTWVIEIVKTWNAGRR